MRVLDLLCVFVPAVGLAAAAPALAETGTLGNVLDIPVTYQVGVPDANGAVAWQSYTIAPCETHEWTWDQGGQPNLHFIWPTWRDQRKDEYGNVLMQRNVVPMADQGRLTVFFPYGDQIWIDSSGSANMDACTAAAAAPPPQPGIGGPAVTTSPQTDVASNSQAATPNIDALLSGLPAIFGLTYVDITSAEGQERALDDVDDLLDRVERGEIMLVDLAAARDGRAPTFILPFETEVVVQSVLLELLSDGTYTPERFKEKLTVYIVQSQALVSHIRSNQGALVGAKN
jgi:hypothetical protein